MVRGNVEVRGVGRDLKGTAFNQRLIRDGCKARGDVHLLDRQGEQALHDPWRIAVVGG